jgi:hypothetical protein
VKVEASSLNWRSGEGTWIRKNKRRKYREYTFKKSNKHTTMQQERITHYNATQGGPKCNQKKKESILFEFSPHAQTVASMRAKNNRPRSTQHVSPSEITSRSQRRSPTTPWASQASSSPSSPRRSPPSRELSKPGAQSAAQSD